jgi:uncharacterized membrane protein
MGNSLHNELRKEFQLERLILFSDAVFAIAITLLVIEIKIPEWHSPDPVSDKALLEKLGNIIPKFIGFLVSFLLIGQYWIVHHRMFGYVINFTGRLIWLNILFLLAVALMPFSTGFYSEYVLENVMTPVIFYSVNIAALGFINFFMWRYISKPERKLSENLSRPMALFFSTRALTVPVIFIVFCIVYYYAPRIAFWLPPLVPLILRVLFNPMKKRALQASAGLNSSGNTETADQ